MPMYDDPTGRRNASGCADPTYRAATLHVERERRRREAEKKKRALAALAKLDGFEIVGGVVLYDPETGRTY